LRRPSLALTSYRSNHKRAGICTWIRRIVARRVTRVRARLTSTLSTLWCFGGLALARTCSLVSVRFRTARSCGQNRKRVAFDLARRARTNVSTTCMPDYYSIDFESALIQPGLLAPPPVVLSWADGERADLVPSSDGWRHQEEWLGDT